MDKYGNNKLPLKIYFGGSFDPLHEGHIHCAIAVQQRLQVACIHLLPCNESINKKPVFSTTDRLSRIKEGLKNYPNIHIDSRELDKGGITYTIDSLQEIRNENNGSSVVFVVGEDVLSTINQWKSWKNLLVFCHIVILKRKGIEQTIPHEVCHWFEKHQSNDEQLLTHKKSGNILFWDVDAPEISSTLIRQMDEQPDKNEQPNKDEQPIE